MHINVGNSDIMAKVRIEELGSIWGKEVNEIRALSVQAVKRKYPIKGYDRMIRNQIELENRFVVSLIALIKKFTVK